MKSIFFVYDSPAPFLRVMVLVMVKYKWMTVTVSWSALVCIV